MCKINRVAWVFEPYGEWPKLSVMKQEGNNMAFCKQCGAELMEGSRFCTNCGSEELLVAAEPVISSGETLREEPQPAYQQPTYAQPSYVGSERREPVASAQAASNAGGYQSAYQQAPYGQSAYGSNHQPPYTPPAAQQSTVMSTGQFLGTLLLLMIPVAGFILMLVWAFGGTDNLNRRNLARAKLILVAIGLVLAILCSILFGALALTSVRLWDSEFGNEFREGFEEGFEEGIEERFGGFDDFSDEFSEDFFNQSYRVGNGAFALQ